DSQYAEANAEYVAAESLWPDSYAPGKTADGLLYTPEPATLPLTFKSTIDGHVMETRLALPQPRDDSMKPSQLVRFFEAQKRGSPLRLTLRKGKVFVGKFASYDSVEERVWFDTPHGGLLNSTSF